MTKEELVDRIFYTHQYTVDREDFKEIIDAFLDSNICIPKDADIVIQSFYDGKWCELLAKKIKE